MPGPPPKKQLPQEPITNTRPCTSTRAIRAKEIIKHLKVSGMPFDGRNMGKYGPLTKEDLNSTLYDFRLKGKTSPIMQLADLYLFPMCMGGYNRGYRPYVDLKRDMLLIDCHLSDEELPSRGIKYYCWELVQVIG